MNPTITRADRCAPTARRWPWVIATTFCFLACSSSEPPTLPTPEPAPATPVADENMKQEIAKLRADIVSLNEKTQTLERNLEVVLRGRRSGLYDDSTVSEGIDIPKSGPSPLTKGDEPPAGRTLEPWPTPAAPSGTAPAPSAAIADAELRMQRGQYGEAVVILSEVQAKTPDLNDGGHSTLLLADCWNRLKQYDNTIQILRTFYLKFPKSQELLQGKILEAQAFEGLGSQERALGLYREVVALGPKTGYAQTARSAMQRLRDAR